MNLLKKINVNSKFEIIRFTVAILISLLLATIIIFALSKEPLVALQNLFMGPLESKRRFFNVIELAIPLTFTGLAISVMFKANQFNMGAEGSFFMGGVIAAIIAIVLPLPPFIHPLVALLIAGLVGGLITLLPAILKLKWDASELVSSLMMNFIVFNLGLYLINNHFRDPNAGSMATNKFSPSAILPNLIPGTRVSFGLIIIIIITILVYLFINKTKLGYELKITGENGLFAKYSGIKVGKVILLSQFIGGALAGIGGGVEILGMYDRFKWQELTNYGFDGIIVAILAKENPKYVPLAAFFLAYLRIGADRMSSASDVTFEMVAILQGFIIMLVAARAFLSKTHQKMIDKEARTNE